MREIRYIQPVRRRKRPGKFRYWVPVLLVIALTGGLVWWYCWKHPLSAVPKISAPAPRPTAVTPKLVVVAPKPAIVAAKPAPVTRPPVAGTNAIVVIPPPLEPPIIPTNPPPVVAPPIVPVPPAETNGWPRPVRDAFEAQLALVAQGISPGSMDGFVGSQTRAAVIAWQQKMSLPLTGELDPNTKSHLLLAAPPVITYTVSPNDLARLQPIAGTWLGKSQQSALDYESILELIAEKTFSHPALIKRLNPGIDWGRVTTGSVLKIPNVMPPELHARAAFVRIHLSGRTLEAFDAGTNLLAHFPCSIAKHVEKRPVGELHVATFASNPNYTFDPEVFPESEEARQLGRKLILPPGPNSPVGAVWIGLDRTGYGIHGTPKPEEVGRTESHGCFRLANWNAEFLLRMISVGTPVYVIE